MNEGKNTTKRKIRLSRRTFIVVILSVCAVALVTEIALLIHSFAKKKSASKVSEEQNYDGYIWLLVEETDSRLGTCKYDYDDLGRCIRVEYNGFFYADRSRPFCEITTVEYVYQDGEPVTILTYPDPQFFESRRRKTYFNSSGTAIYDARYQRLYVEETDEYSDELRVMDERSYDENGYETLDRSFYEGAVFSEIVSEYDRYGHTILRRIVWNNGENVDFVRFRGTCDSLGRVYEIRDKNGELCTRIEYNDDGGYKEAYYHNREVEPYREVWYNAGGEAVREESNGEVVFRREATKQGGYRTIEKESHGALTEEFDQRGLLIAHDFVYYVESGAQEGMNSYRMTYDDAGRLIREECSLSDGTKHLILVKYSFDSYGNVIAEKWSGTDEHGNKTYRYIPVKLTDEQLAERAKFCQDKGIYTRLTERVIYR